MTGLDGEWRRWLSAKQRTALEPMQGMSVDEKFDYLCIQIFDVRDEQLRAREALAPATLKATEDQAAAIAIALKKNMNGTWTFTAAQRTFASGLGFAAALGVVAALKVLGIL